MCKEKGNELHVQFLISTDYCACMRKGYEGVRQRMVITMCRPAVNKAT